MIVRFCRTSLKFAYLLWFSFCVMTLAVTNAYIQVKFIVLYSSFCHFSCFLPTFNRVIKMCVGVLGIHKIKLMIVSRNYAFHLYRESKHRAASVFFGLQKLRLSQIEILSCLGERQYETLDRPRIIR